MYGLTLSVEFRLRDVDLNCPCNFKGEIKYLYKVLVVGRDSSVGIATPYGLDGPGIESWLRQDFPNLSRPALGPTQLSIQSVTGPSPGGKVDGVWH